MFVACLLPCAPGSFRSIVAFRSPRLRLLCRKIDLASQTRRDAMFRIGQLEPVPEGAATRVKDGVDDLHGGAIFSADGVGRTNGGDQSGANLGKKSDRQGYFDVQRVDLGQGQDWG